VVVQLKPQPLVVSGHCQRIGISKMHHLKQALIPMIFRGRSRVGCTSSSCEVVLSAEKWGSKVGQPLLTLRFSLIREYLHQPHPAAKNEQSISLM
jgi:hypothetical protein